MQPLSDEEAFDRDITMVRHMTRRVAEQWALLEECWDWLEAGLSLTHCRKLGWIDFRQRLSAHLGKQP